MIKQVILRGENLTQRFYKYKNPSIYWLAEINTANMLNSKKIKHSWKKDFRMDSLRVPFREKNKTYPDLVNSQRIKIEVKATINKNDFSKNRVRVNNKSQHKHKIIKVLIDKKGKIKDYKFIKKVKGVWEDITPIL